MFFKYYLLFFAISLLSIPTEPAQNNKINAVDKIKQMCEIYKGYRYKNFYEDNPKLNGDPIPRLKLDCIEQEPLIVKGMDAQPKEFPHMALIGYGEKIEDVTWNCGGSLISERFVLSAAHCNHGSHGTPTWVRLGEHDLKSSIKENEAPYDYKIVQTYEHKDYNPRKSYHAITLYKLHQNENFNAFIRPLCLYPHETLKNDETEAYITGWGANETDGNLIDVLQKAKVKIVEIKECEITFHKSVQKFSKGFKPKFQLFAGDLKNGSATCQGDSGEPLQILIPNEKCMFYQIGITSIGVRGCGDKTHTAVYTNVGKYLNWIQKIVWPN